MNTAQPSLIAELEAAVRSSSSQRRSAMLRRVTDLFIGTAPNATQAQTGVFDDVFEHLTKEIERKAVRELSHRVAAVENAPERLIRRLANDDAIEISGPVLERSAALADEDLVAIARTKSQAHLEAIAGRAQLHECVTDVLVERGHLTVARKVAANSGATFSDGSLASLVGRASEDGDLASAVARRRDLPGPMFRKLLARATETVRKRLLDSAPPATVKAINKILAEISQEVEETTAPKRDYGAAKRLVIDMHKKGALTPSTLVQFAKALKIQEMVVTLSLLTNVSIDVIDRFMDESDDDPMLILCKAIDLDWNTTTAVLAARLKLEQLRETQADDINKKYRKLTAYSAQRVLRFWQAREKVAG